MDNTILINRLSDEVDNLFQIYKGLAAHISDTSPGSSLLRSPEVRQLGITIQRLQEYVQTMSRQTGLEQVHEMRTELDKTYTVTFSDEGWRIRFQPDVAPHFGLEPGRSLREVVERVGELYPEYCARLTGSQKGQLRQEQGIVTELHEAELAKELERTRRAAGSVGAGLLGGRGSDVRELQKAAPER
jgi:hypothetical protein